MPIMAANAQSDARGSAWLLANAASRCLADPTIAPQWQDALNNTYRLLEAFRLGIFSEPVSTLPARPTTYNTDLFTMSRRSERHLSEVREAFESALKSTFLGTSKDAAVEDIATVLRAVSNPKKFSASPDQTRKAAVFFQEFLKQLST